MARCMLLESNLPKMLWTYAVMTAEVTRNRCYNNRIHQTPYYALTGKKPDLSKMREFGSACYAYKQNKKKLDARCEKGIFVGYDKNSPAYLVYYPDTGKVLKHRLVKFITRCVTEHQTQTDISMSDDDSHGDRYVSSHSKQNVANRIQKSLMDLKLRLVIRVVIRQREGIKVHVILKEIGELPSI